MSQCIKPLLRMFILFALVCIVRVLAKPTSASAFALTCCQNCENIMANCLSRCTTQACKLACVRQSGLCFGTCNGGCPQ